MKHFLSVAVAVACLAASVPGAYAKNPQHAEDPAVVGSQGTEQLPQPATSPACDDSAVVTSSSSGVSGFPENKADLRDGAGASGVPNSPDCQSASGSGSSLPDPDADLPNNKATERESE